MELMVITRVPAIASIFESAGVNRIFLDMETLGKHERQANANTPIYSHSFEDVAAVKAALKRSEVMVRINPIHPGTREEVSRALDAGADVLMLPFFKTAAEVETFLDIVRGRAKTNILFETAQAVGRAEQILGVAGYDEVHFGLNDLRIGLGLDFLFESFAGGLIEWLCGIAARNGRSYGIGGVGRIGREALPAELIVKEHVRLGSQRVILSRVFHGEAQNSEQLAAYVDVAAEVAKLREVEHLATQRTPAQVENDRLAFGSAVEKVVKSLQKRREDEARLTEKRL